MNDLLTVVRVTCGGCVHLMNLPQTDEFRVAEDNALECRQQCERCDTATTFTLTVTSAAGRLF